MVEWLKNNFTVDILDGQETIGWTTYNGTSAYVTIDFMVATFGSNKLSKNQMVDLCPTDGWREIIERWDELGKFS